MGEDDCADDVRTRAESSSGILVSPPAGAPGFRLVGRYTLLRELGRGGMGTVYAAYDAELDRKVAIKLLHHKPSGSLGAPRLLGEAQALARLSHPNVVQVYDVGELGDQVFVSMEYVEGETLREWQCAATRSWREVFAVYRQAGEGLAAAHAAGLIHRDVKPDNLMLGNDGRVRVMDFGLARRSAPLRDEATASGSRSTTLDEHPPTGSLLGTPAYMPIEQMRGEAVGAEADTFAFCVSLWEGLHGVRPFAGQTLAELRAAVGSGRVVEPPADRPTPRWLRDALIRGLAPEPARRWPSIAALLAALDRGLGRTYRRRAAARVFAALAGVAALAFAGALWQRAEHRERVADCEALAVEVEAAWSAEARDHLRAAMLASGLPFAAGTVERVLPRLDVWAEEWSRIRSWTCSQEHVEKEWSSELRARADDCLEERLINFSAQVSELSIDPEKSLAGAVEVVASLGAPATCADPQQLTRRPALPAGGGDGLRELRRALARVAALGHAGQFSEGEALARQTLVAAEALGWSPMVAEARLRLGAMEGEQSRFEASAEDLEAAFFTAARASAHELAADAAMFLSFVVGYGMGRRDEGLRWSRIAELELLDLATGGRTTLDAEWINYRGLIHQKAGDYGDSIADFRAALALGEAVYGLDHPRIATYLNNIAITQGQLGEREAAQESAARALAHAERTLGPDHPTIANFARTLAIRTMNVARRLADPAAAAREYERADALYERALGIARRTFGPESVSVSNLLQALALLRYLRGASEGVESMLRDSLALLEKHNPNDAQIAAALTLLASIQDGLGDSAAALPTIQRALAEVRRMVPHDHPDTANALDRLGLIHLHLGDSAAARAPIEEAYAIRLKILASPFSRAESLRTLALLGILGGDLARGREHLERAAADSTDGELAEARFALAQATWEREPDARPAALALAELARDGLAGLGKRGDRERAAVESWLAARR